MNSTGTTFTHLACASMEKHGRRRRTISNAFHVLSPVHAGRWCLVLGQGLNWLPQKGLFPLILFLVFLLGTFEILHAHPVIFEDAAGNRTTASKKPRGCTHRVPTVTKEKTRIRTKLLDLPLPYVRSARVEEASIFDFLNKTLVVEFKEPMHITSTLEGERHGMLAVGNHYCPPACWGINHGLGFERLRNHIHRAIGKSRETSSFLFTGADMENLSVQKAQFRDMAVYALVTGGVESNAVRMAVDKGEFYEPGTINMLIMTNMRLTARARARAIISATEAKTAAMQDLDVRSVFGPARNQATGTGTDEIIVVGGRGTTVDNAGGHCKMGELIAKAAYDGVKDAVRRQNGVIAGRTVLLRLQERGLDLHALLGNCNFTTFQDGDLQGPARLEDLLLQPRYASFVEVAFVLSDAYEKGQVTDLALFETWCRNVAEEIAGSEVRQWTDCITSPDIPVPVRMSLNGLINGLAARKH